MPSEPHHNIYIVTGRVQSGKTGFLGSVITRLKNEKIKPVGFLSVGTFRNGQRDSFTLESIEDGNKIPFVSVEKVDHWIGYGRFYFNPEAFKEGERIIRRGMEKRADLLVLDELGPIELKGGGWYQIVKDLDKEYHMAQIWVVREVLLGQVMERWNIPENNVFTLDPGEEDRINQTILRHVRNDEIGPAT